MLFSKPDRSSPSEFPSGSPAAGDSASFADLPATPISDRRLIDYLMAQPVAAGSAPDTQLWGDDQIERWLAQDVANVERLEDLAVAIVGLATGVVQPERSVLADLPDVPGSVRPGSIAGSGQSSRGYRRGWVLAGACSAACLAVVLWSLRDNSQDEATGRVAMAWSEFTAVETAAPVIPPAAMGGSWDSPTGDWEPGWSSAADAEDFTVMAEQTGDESGFAAGGDSPPDWLVFAVARLDDSISPVDLGEDSER